MILLENKNTCFDFTGVDPELLMRAGGGGGEVCVCVCGGGGGARFDQMSVLILRFWKDRPEQTV